ncbi:MAG TPA: type II toxin-antitoxin system RelE/ParE family toxin [Isosphaeraceae bacterium]|jgi:toxin ParE1/3/4
MAGKAPRVVRSRAAIGDLIEIAAYFAETRGPDAARRFGAAASATFKRLARMPGLGARWDERRPALAGLRVAAVEKYRNHLVFYRPIAGGIEVVRVLHGAKDLDHLLDPDAEED